MTPTEIRTAIENCFVGHDMTTREGKSKAIIACLDMFRAWDDAEARAYIEATEDPGFDLSPAAFSASRNHSISVQ